MRHGVQKSPSTGEAKRSLSIPSASPQHRQSAVWIDFDCGERRDRQSSQTGIDSGEESSRSRGPPHTRQSAGKTVLTRSSTTKENARAGLRSTAAVARHSITPPGGLPGGPPGGAPVETSSALSFMLSLKTHLTRWRSRSLRPPQPKYSSTRPTRQ